MLNIIPKVFTFIFSKLGNYQSHVETSALVQITSLPHKRLSGNINSASKKGVNHLLDPSGKARKKSFQIKVDLNIPTVIFKKPVQIGTKN